jgi:hypothetical protein
MKYFILAIISIGFIGCNGEKISQLEYSLTQAQQENIRLNEEIQKLKETDQSYYQFGADEYNLKNYSKAIDWMNNLKLKFPQSSLIPSADKLIRDSNIQIQAIYQTEKQVLNQIIADAKKIEIEESITLLSDYISEDHPADLIETAVKSLNEYKAEYEKIRAERELEQSLGIRLVEYATGWGFVNDFSARLFVPQLRLVFKNITDRSLKNINIKTDFVKTSGDEIFGDSTDYLVGYDSVLEPGYSKTAFANCNVGYRNEISFSSAPNLYANIYINNKFFRKIPIAQKYRQ